MRCCGKGKRIRAWPVVTLPKPEFVIFSSAEVSSHRQIQQVERTSMTLLPVTSQGVAVLHHRFTRPTGRCPVQSSTPLGLTK
jgi:hypothetical protein